MLLILLLFICGCNKKDNPEFSKILIKGSVTGGVSNKKAGLFMANNEVSLSDAQKVILFYSSGDYDVFNVVNGTFTAGGYEGSATAVVFVGNDNSYIGCLQAGSLSVLPLVSLRDGDKTVIDLSSLTLDGTNVIPSNNPIGKEIVMNEDEIERLRQFGAFYESLSQNIDLDTNGKADIIEDKEILVSTIHDIYGGKWGLNNSGPQVISESNFHVSYSIRLWGGNSIKPQSNTEINLSGPVNSPYSNIEQYHFADAPDGFIAFFRRSDYIPMSHEMPYGDIYPPFKNGKYKITVNDQSYSFNYYSVDAKYLFVLAIPTVHTNEMDEVTYISVEYRNLDGSSVNAQNFVYQTMVQLNDKNSQIEQIGLNWESPKHKTNTELFNFVPTKKILVSDLDRINVFYVDLVGNSYNIFFTK
ncbi:MAG: hypothetical protein N2662_11525 [Bacteroidales bacterium]|nr:hypothetical protein [Bacteroidales bacterium]